MKDKEICTVSIGEFGLDNDFTFYNDGRIKRFYDEHSFSINNTDWVEPNDIRASYKIKIINKLEGNLKEQVYKILYP